MWKENKNKLDIWCKFDVYSFVKIGFFVLVYICLFIKEMLLLIKEGFLVYVVWC